MSEPGDFSLRLPRPGKAVKLVLALVGAFAILGAIFVSGNSAGTRLFLMLTFRPDAFHHLDGIPPVWSFLTSGVLTSPDGISHAIFSMIGLYFMTTDLERRWGPARLLRFLGISVVVGNLAVLAGSFVPLPYLQLHPPLCIGPLAAISATAIAWAKDNRNGQARFMFLLPMSGRTFFWIAIAGSALVLLSPGTPEGALAPLGGCLAGVLFAGSPSPARAFWLRLRLGSMRRRGGITVADLLEGSDGDVQSRRPKTSPTRSGKVPPLRIVQGGLDDDLKNRKPPKDKRYLN